MQNMWPLVTVVEISDKSSKGEKPKRYEEVNILVRTPKPFQDVITTPKQAKLLRLGVLPTQIWYIVAKKEDGILG